MYRFDVGGKHYGAKVSYSWGDTLYPVKDALGEFHIETRITTVELGEVRGVRDGKPELDVFASGIAVLHPGDNFVKAVGRHVAARQALDFAYASESVPQDQEFAKAVMALFPKA